MNVMDKKIGLLTWTRYNNYGSVLQAYALKTFISTKNFDPVFIDYMPTREIKKISIFRERGEIIQKLINRMLVRTNIYIKNESTKQVRFDNFRNDYFKYTEIYGKDNINEVNEKFNIFISGSDQIWSPVVFDSNYFLKFVDKEKLKIAYAPSFGTVDIKDENIINEVKELIPRFKYLSTREKTGNNIIKSITGLNSNLVVDPTLLLGKTDWQKLSSEVTINESNILLCYFLGDNVEHWNDVEFIAKELGLTIYVIPTSPKSYFYKRYNILENVGIEEFLGYIDKASFICTDSFHGTIFSIIYNKKFRVYKRFHEKSIKNQNSRVLNILEITNSTSYIYDGIPKNIPVCNPIELDNLNNLISDSKKFLVEAVSYHDTEDDV